MIKVTTSEQDSKPSNEYPKLVRYTDSGNIVLLTSKNKGTLVKLGPRDTDRLSVGHHCTTWNQYRTREDYTGTVTLENIV